jgi:hypothetical protein
MGDRDGQDGAMQQGLSSGAKATAFVASAISVYALLSLIYLGLGGYHEQLYWEALERAPASAASVQLAKDVQALEQGPVPIRESMRQLAHSAREAIPAIRPESAARAPLPGWVHSPDFKSAVQAVDVWRKAHESTSAGAAAASAKEAP